MRLLSTYAVTVTLQVPSYWLEHLYIIIITDTAGLAHTTTYCAVERRLCNHEEEVVQPIPLI